jgi:altronate dehydratase large subunit
MLRYQRGKVGVLEKGPKPPGWTSTPFLWATANPKTYAAATDSIDFYSGTVIEGSETPEHAGERLYRTVIDVASGTLSRSETLFYTEPIDMSLEEPRF